jgi:hypothetical protein
VFHNLVNGMELTAPNQAWAADITYIRTDEGFLYRSPLTGGPIWPLTTKRLNVGLRKYLSTYFRT